MAEDGRSPDYLATLSAFARALPEPGPDYCLIGALALVRRRRVAIGGLTIDVASAEDLMLLKLRAGRDQDFVDVVGVAARQGPALDVAYLRAWAGRLGITGELEFALGAVAP